MALTMQRDGYIDKEVEEEVEEGDEEEEDTAGTELCWLTDVQDKIVSVQEDAFMNDPGQSLAWLVLIQVILYYLCTSSIYFLSIATYITLFAYIYFKWIYPGLNNSPEENEALDEAVPESDQEPEWLVNQFFCYVQQHVKDTYKFNPSNKEDKESFVPEVEEEPKWLLDRFLCHVQHHEQEPEDDEQVDTETSLKITPESQKTDQNANNPVTTNHIEKNPNSDVLDLEPKVMVPVVSMVTSSVTSITNTATSYTFKDECELDEDDFEIISSEDLKLGS
eukprot:GFUD01028157.1.p1 GENE.GFUD01028157.1~~GFUD01028157.1.p1  ORF type:complete len:301 (-),score=86.25 GFUD01028157.1:9-842(-)